MSKRAQWEQLAEPYSTSVTLAFGSPILYSGPSHMGGLGLIGGEVGLAPDGAGGLASCGCAAAAPAISTAAAATAEAI
jgi:hypothetical protein